jgi:hypothetical protein
LSYSENFSDLTGGSQFSLVIFDGDDADAGPGSEGEGDRQPPVSGPDIRN